MMYTYLSDGCFAILILMAIAFGIYYNSNDDFKF